MTYFGGLVSGLDTQSLVAQLLEVERIPLLRLDGRRRELQAKDQAWQTVNTKLSALRNSVDTLISGSSLARFATATSSHQEVASGTVTGAPEPQTLSFKVDRLATRHELVSNAAFASADALVGAGTFTVTVDGTDHHVVTDASTTLADLARAVSELGVGVTATVLKVADGVYELRLTANQTGSASVFTASGDQPGLGTLQVARQGQDAQLTVGSLILTRSTNTVTDLIDGVTIHLHSPSSDEVTVTVGRDLDGAAAAVKRFVDSLNGAITTLKDLAHYNPDTQQGGPLLGDGTARAILASLQNAVATTVTTGPFTHAGSVGIEVTRDGLFQFDEAKLREALETDFAAVVALLSRSGSATDDRVQYVRSTDSTVAGTYDLEVTQAATVAAVTGDPYTAPASDVTFQVTSGTTTVDVTITADSSLADAISQVNAQLAAAGVTTITADDAGGALRLAESRYGSAVSFTVTGSGAFRLDGTFTGTDVQGTIGGVVATGTGQLLSVDSGDPSGLSVTIAATQAELDAGGGSLALGQVTVSHGVVGSVSAALATAEGGDGAVARARDHWAAQIEIVNDRIEAFEERLARVEEQLIMRFAQLETTLSRLYAQQSWLQMQLVGMSQNGVTQ